jgi:hypothetical protein
MIRIGVFSDSHGDLNALKRAVDHAGRLDMAIHCGDYFEDIVKVLEDTPIVYEGVCGNVDVVRHAPLEQQLEIGGLSIFITHGHIFDVKHDLNRLFYKGLELQVDICLFGHTHIAQIIEKEGLILMNPGSVTRPKAQQKASYGIIEIEHKIPNCRTISF